MSIINSAASASTAIGLFAHGHKKAGRSDTLGAAGDSQGRASTQDLFGSLLQSLEQVIGVSTAAAATAVGAKVTAALRDSAATGGASSSNPLGSRVSANA